MFTKVILICAIAAVALAIEYPPGISPVLCPNYPNCDMELLARYTPLTLPEYEIPYGRMAYAAPYPYPYPYPYPIAAPLPAAPVVAPVAEPAAMPSAPLYPADVDPASCPNYPYCA
ncbi:cuticle protein 1-like [Leguminivora glycinivorella]|uniref:cuticle protein 1-like n=1 Tax=Leguminivora glycinivorella TaxID=1035111 RepID=UPI00200D5BEF|nr:cuticle protein 1-like [Leguminivora glycinivorella]